MRCGGFSTAPNRHNRAGAHEAAVRTSYLAKRHSASERRSAVQRSVIRTPQESGEPGLQSEWPDLKQAHIIKTGDRSYCLC